MDHTALGRYHATRPQGAVKVAKAELLVWKCSAAQIRATAPDVGAAAFDLNADSRAPAAADWEPAQGNVVRLLTLGESNGQIMSGPDAKGKYTVKVCGSFTKETADDEVIFTLSRPRDGVQSSFCEPAEVMP